MRKATPSSGSEDRLSVVREERAAIRAELVRLHARDEELVRVEERIRIEDEASAENRPYLVRAAYLVRELDMSERTFYRLIANEAKGFPKPVSSIDSDRRWVWQHVAEWLEIANRAATKGGRDQGR